jgi:hypothetical protein
MQNNVRVVRRAREWFALSLQSALIFVTGSIIVGCADAPATTVVEKIDVPLPKPDLLARQSPPHCESTKPPALAKLEAQPDTRPPRKPADDWSPFDPDSKSIDDPADDASARADRQRLIANQNAVVARKIAVERDCYSKAEKSARDRLGWLQSAVKTTINAVNSRNEEIERQQLTQQSPARSGPAGGDGTAMNGPATR